MTKVGIINFKDHSMNTAVSNIGTAQGSSLSPLLFNIYMTKLDRFIEKLMSKFNRVGGKKISDSRFKKKITTFGPNSCRFLTGGKEGGTIRDTIRNDPQAIVKVRSDKNEILATHLSLSVVVKTYGLSRKKLSEALNTEGRYILDTNTHLQ